MIFFAPKNGPKANRHQEFLEQIGKAKKIAPSKNIGYGWFWQKMRWMRGWVLIRHSKTVLQINKYYDKQKKATSTS